MSSSKPYILVLNCGSSSIKFAIIQAATGEAPVKGLAENLFRDDSRLEIKANGEKTILSLPANANHKIALLEIGKALAKFEKLNKQLVAVGHRVVHGAEYFEGSVVIDASVKNAIDKTSIKAPLHNPANLAGIESAVYRTYNENHN